MKDVRYEVTAEIEEKGQRAFPIEGTELFETEQFSENGNGWWAGNKLSMVTLTADMVREY